MRGSDDPIILLGMAEESSANAPQQASPHTKLEDHPPSGAEAAHGTAHHDEHSANPNKTEEKPKKLGLVGGMKEIFRSLRSTDAPSRKMAFLFILSLICLIGVFVNGVILFRQNQFTSKAVTTATKEHREKHKSAGHGGKTEEGSETDHYKKRLADLGSFQIEIKSGDREAAATQVSNLAVLEIVLLCDTPETAGHMKHELPKVRNILLNVFLALERDDLISNLGKKKLKLNMVKKLNTWLPSGQVEDIFFSKLVLN